MNDNYISVLMIQAKIDVDITPTSELAIFNQSWWNQWNQAQDLIFHLKPDIAIFPETFYNPEVKQRLIDYSNDYTRLIIAGSTYVNRQNFTVMFYEGKEYSAFKNNPSPLEAAGRFMPYQDFDSLYEKRLWDECNHTFIVKNKKVIILNCMEYYNSAYFIARSKQYNENLFGIICPCSSSNIELFEQETIAINNHQENIYTFLCNRISPNPISTTKGKSYIYGTHTKTEKRFLAQEHPQETSLNHLCGIVRLSEDPSYVYGEFAINTNFSPFGRSDNFLSTPRNLTIGELNE